MSLLPQQDIKLFSRQLQPEALLSLLPLPVGYKRGDRLSALNPKQCRVPDSTICFAPPVFPDGRSGSSNTKHIISRTYRKAFRASSVIFASPAFSRYGYNLDYKISFVLTLAANCSRLAFNRNTQYLSAIVLVLGLPIYLNERFVLRSCPVCLTYKQ